MFNCSFFVSYGMTEACGKLAMSMVGLVAMVVGALCLGICWWRRSKTQAAGGVNDIKYMPVRVDEESGLGPERSRKDNEEDEQMMNENWDWRDDDDM